MAGLRKDEQALAMYERYCTGLSLAQVAAEFGVSRQSVYELLSARDFELRERPARGQTVVYRGLNYTIGNNGYYRCTISNRHLLHRRMWEEEVGPIPDGWDIHHVDEDKLHNEVSNFECLPKADHTRLHSPRCNQHTHRCNHAEVMPDEEATHVDLVVGGFP